LSGGRVNPRRWIILVYAVVFAAFCAAAGAALLDGWAQYKQLKQVERLNQQKLAQAEAKLHEQEIALQRLKTDPEYVERAIRQRLKYAKPGEVIFRFPE